MANKEFQVRHGLAVNNNVLVANTVTGNVGIGTSTANAKLDIGGDVTNKIRLSSSGDSTNFYSEFINYYNSGKAFEIMHGGVSFLRTSQQGYYNVEFGPAQYHWRTNYGDGYISANTNSAERMRITSTGNVGIGTTAPANKLDVRGTIGVGQSSNSALNIFTVTSSIVGSDNHSTTFAGPVHGTNDVITFDLNRGGGAYGAFDVKFNSTSRFLIPGAQLYGDGYINLPTNSNFVFKNNNVEGMRFDANGRVGIGTTTPLSKLSVYGTGSSGMGLFISYGHPAGWGLSGAGEGGLGFITSTSNTFRFHTSGYNYPLTLDGSTVILQGSGATGNVGIGTTTPSAKLHVAGDAIFTGNVTISGNTSYMNTQTLLIGDNLITLNADIPSNTPGTENAGIEVNRGSLGNASFIWDETSDRWDVRANNNNLVSIFSTGRVGIGTSSIPAANLEINATAIAVPNTVSAILSRGYDVNFAIMSSTGHAVNDPGSLVGRFGLRYLTDSSDSASLNFYRGGGSLDGSIGINTDGTERMRIDASGNVGIGVTSVTAKFVSSGTARIGTLTTDYAGDVQLSADYVRIWNPGNAPAGQIRFGINQETTIRGQALVGLMFDTDGSERMRIANTGNIGIGTNTPSYRLDVNAAVANGVRFDGARPITFNSNGTGDIRIKAGAGGWSIGYLFSGSAGTDIGGFGAWGSNDSLGYHWIGSAYNTPTAVFTPGGNVGIGTTSPSAPLHVTGNASGKALRLVSSAGSGILTFDFNDQVINANVSTDFYLTSGYRNFYTAGGGGWGAAHLFRTTSARTYSIPGSSVDFIYTIDSFAPTANNGAYYHLSMQPIINQTGTANGNYTGIYLNVSETAAKGPSNRLIDLRTGGTSRFFVSNTGFTYAADNVAIGQTSAPERLTVFRDTDNSAEIGKAHVGFVGYASYAGFSHINMNGVGNYALLQGPSGETFLNSASGQAIYFRQNNTDRMILDYLGNLGIGTTGPNTLLHIYKGNTAAHQNFIKIEMPSWAGSAGYNKNIVWHDGGGDVAGIGAYFDGTSVNFSFHSMYNGGLKTAANSVMNIMGTGRVGIGTTSPLSALHANTADNNWGSFVSSPSGGVRIGGYITGFVSPTIQGVTGNGGDYQRLFIDAANIAFGISGTTRAFIDSSGQVGIGTGSNTLYTRFTVSGGNQDQWEFNSSVATYNGGTLEYINRSSFNNRPDMTLYVGAANSNMKFATAGAERMRIDSAGNIGIGTTSPGLYTGHTTLAINNATNGGLIDLLTNGTRHLTLYSGTSTSVIGTVSSTALSFISNNTERMRVLAGGNVGIANTNPIYTLDVGGSGIRTSGGTIIAEGSTQGQIIVRKTGLEGFNLFSDAASTLKFYDTAGFTRMMIDSSGRVSIGASSPSSFANGFISLQVNQSSIFSNGFNNLNLGTNIAGGVDGGGGSGIYGSNDFAARYTQLQGTHRWAIAASGTAGNPITWNNAMILDRTGSLGIGTTTPAANVHVKSNANATMRLEYAAGGIYSAGYEFAVTGYANPAGLTYYDNGTELRVWTQHPTSSKVTLFTANTERMRINTNGNVGIGNTAPDALLHVAGTTILGGDTVGTMDVKFSRLLGGIRAINHWFTQSANSPWYLFGQNMTWTGERTGTVDPTHAHRPYYEAYAPVVGYKEFGFANVSSGSIASSNLIANMVLTNTGNIGMGSLAPAEKLHVVGNILLPQSTANTGAIVGVASSDSFTTSGVIMPHYGMKWASPNDSVGPTGFLSAFYGFRFFSAGAEAMRIDANTRNVGIGTTAPSQKLEVAGIALINGLRLNGTDGNVNQIWQSNSNIPLGLTAAGGPIIFGQTSSEKMRITANGNVGIGTSAPIEYGNTSTSLTIQGTNFASINLRDAASSTRTEVGAVSTESFLKSVTNLPLTLYTNNTERMRIDASGNVGIGTTSPDVSLHVYKSSGNGVIKAQGQNVGLLQVVCDTGSTYAQLSGFSGSLRLNASTSSMPSADASQFVLNANGDISIGRSTIFYPVVNRRNISLNATGGSIIVLGYNDNPAGYIVSDLNGTEFTEARTGILKFGTASLERMRIDAGGNIGIGTTSITQDISGSERVLQVANTNAASLYLHSTNGNKWQISSITGGSLSFYNNAVQRMTVDSSGNVAIGQSSTTYKLQVNGSFAANTKSFVIDHPTKPGMKLRHGSLEGPENGVYVRGKTKEKVIELPEYWRGLVDSSTITVQLTAIGRSQNLYVVDVSDNRVYIDSENYTDVDCYYYIQAERKDVEKLVVEY